MNRNASHTRPTGTNLKPIPTSALTPSLDVPLDAKRRLYAGIVDNLEPLGIPRNHVKILLREIPAENWGIRGGQAGCDVELGFKIDV
jgi:hypothetical protein